MSDATGLSVMIAVAAVFFPLLWRHAREVDRLETAYRSRIQEHHPAIALDRKRGAVQYLVIDGVVYPSTVVDFRSRCRKEPGRVNEIIDEYVRSIPSRYEHQGQKREAG